MTIIKNQKSYNGVIIVGCVFSLMISMMMLSDPTTMDKGGLPYGFMGWGFLIFGIFGLLNLADDLWVMIYHDRIEKKSLFRKRVILKKDIRGYGKEAYAGKYLSGNRIRIFGKNKSFKFHTSQLETIRPIEDFVRGSKVKKNAFRIEQITEVVAYVVILALLFSPLIYEKYFSAPTAVEKVDSIGIPVFYKKDIKIIKDENNVLTFKLQEYHDFVFQVNKDDIPNKMEEITEELLLMIYNKNYAQLVSGKRDVKTNNPVMEIPIDEIIVLTETH